MRQLGKITIIGVVLALGMAFAPSASAAPEAAAGAADSSPNISITQVNKPYTWWCVPSALALSYTAQSTPTQFIITVKLSQRPCNVVYPHAVIYKMPGPYGNAWPQTLSEKQTFTLSRAGTTTITFEKGCDYVQFDVLTGSTPNVISPWGAWHGLPLFPLANNQTSMQYWGTNCNPGGECDDYTPTQVGVNPATVAPGDQVTVSGTGVPGDTITATLHTNSAVVLGTGVVNGSGQFTITGTVPLGTPPGDYNIVLTSEKCPTETAVTVTVGGALVANNVSASLPGGDSPATDPLRISAAGVALILGLFALTRLAGRRVRSRTVRS